MKRNMRGFTLAELLIVVAIIAVLVAIAIPLFTRQLEKSRESVDFSNMRSAYAEVMVAAISGDAGSPLKMENGTFQARITLKQKQENWQTAGVENMRIGDAPYDKWNSKLPAIGGTATVTFYPDSDNLIIDWSGSGSGSESGNGSGSTYDFHGAGHEIGQTEFCNIGVVLQDDTGTCVFYLSGIYEMWDKYHNKNMSVAELAEKYPQTATMVDASNIKDSSSDTIEKGDIYYNSADNKYYYVDKINDYETSVGKVPNTSWIELKQY